MTEELITPHNLSLEFLKSIFDAAFMDASIGEDVLTVSEDVKCTVLIDSDEPDVIVVCSVWECLPGTSELLALQTANLMSSQNALIKIVGVLNSDGCDWSLVICQSMPVTWGMTKKALIQTVKRFCARQRDMIGQHAGGVLQ